ncbi:MAG: TolC family protein, partial [Gemmatimonadales bacterium]
MTSLSRFGIPIAAVAILATPAPALGQAPDPLAAIVAEALRNNLGLAQESLAVERAEAGVREARGRFFPSLSLDARYSEQSGTLDLGELVNPAYAALNRVTGTNQFPTDIEVNFPLRHESRLRLAQPLFDASILAGHSLAKHTRDGQRLEHAGAARRLAAEAQAAFLEVGAARSARRTWEATMALVTESERVAQRLVDAGRATPDQVLRARADLSEVEQRLDEARQVEDAAARALNRLLRRPLDEPVAELPDSLIRFRIALSGQQAVASALARREELGGTEAGIRAAEAGVRLASASFLPTVALALDYGFQGNDLSFGGDDDFAIASIVLSW